MYVIPPTPRSLFNHCFIGAMLTGIFFFFSFKTGLKHITYKNEHPNSVDSFDHEVHPRKYTLGRCLFLARIKSHPSARDVIAPGVFPVTAGITRYSH